MLNRTPMEGCLLLPVQRAIYSGGVLNDIRVYSAPRHQRIRLEHRHPGWQPPRNFGTKCLIRERCKYIVETCMIHSCLTGGKASESVSGLVTQKIGLHHRIHTRKKGYNSVGTQNHINRCAAFRYGARQNGSRGICRIRRCERRCRCQPGCDCDESRRLRCNL